MASTKHTKVSQKADGSDNTLVMPSDWNAPHDVEVSAAGVVLGRDTSGPGAVQELPIAVTPTGDVSFPNSTGAFGLASGTTAQRPSAPAPGMVRWNSTLGVLEVYDGTVWQPVVMGSSVPVGASVGWYGTTPPAGWLLINGATLGDETTSATWAGQLYSNLFAYWWNNQSQAQCPVSGGRGSTAALDWAAHKTIQMPDERGRVEAMPDNGTSILPDATVGDMIGPGPGSSASIVLTRSQIPGALGGILNTGSEGPNIGQLTGAPGPPVFNSDGGFGAGAPVSMLQPTVVKNRIVKY